MFLKGENIFLRALEPSDADLLYRWENDPGLWPVSFTQIPFSRFVLDEFVNAAFNDIYTNKQLRLIVCRTGDAKPAGVIDLFDFDPQHLRCGVGIYINEEFRNQGFASESIDLVRRYCFEILHLKQMYAHVNKSNESSLALFANKGFEKIGLKRSWNRTGLNEYEDVWFLQCLNPVGS